MSVMVQKDATRWSGDRTDEATALQPALGVQDRTCVQESDTQLKRSPTTYEHADFLGRRGNRSFMVGVNERF